MFVLDSADSLEIDECLPFLCNKKRTSVNVAQIPYLGKIYLIPSVLSLFALVSNFQMIGKRNFKVFRVIIECQIILGFYHLIDCEEVPLPPTQEQTTPGSLHTSPVHTTPLRTFGTNNTVPPRFVQPPTAPPPARPTEPPTAPPTAPPLYGESTTESPPPTYDQAMAMQR